MTGITNYQNLSRNASGPYQEHFDDARARVDILAKSGDKEAQIIAQERGLYRLSKVLTSSAAPLPSLKGRLTPKENPNDTISKLKKIEASYKLAASSGAEAEYHEAQPDSLEVGVPKRALFSIPPLDLTGIAPGGKDRAEEFATDGLSDSETSDVDPDEYECKMNADGQSGAEEAPRNLLERITDCLRNLLSAFCCFFCRSRDE